MNAVAATQGRSVSGNLLRALRAVPQYTRMSRHLWSVLRHSTPRKLLNLAVVETEFRLRRTTLRGRPYILIVDPTNVCNLRCPLCPTGLGDLGGRKGQMMPWETFTHVVDQMAPYAYEINLHNWGESILHPHIFDMIAYAKSRDLATNMSANLNRITPENIDRLVESGLEYLILSIDGASQETYQTYRRNGDFNTVLANARALLRRRRELGRRTPFVEWQFIVFRHNGHEVEKARAMAAEIGVDRFRVIPPGLYFDAPNPEQLKQQWLPAAAGSDQAQDFRGTMKSACFYLYRAFTTNPDGKAAPCCVVFGAPNDFGDMLTQDFDQIWNNDKYRSARAQFRAGGQVDTPTVCDRCEMFEKHARFEARQSVPAKG